MTKQVWLKLQGKMLSRLQREMLGFNNAKVKPSHEITTSRIRMSKKEAGVAVEVMVSEVRGLDGPSDSTL